MKLRLCVAVLVSSSVFFPSVQAQQPQPPGVSEAFMNIASQPATHTSVVFDRDMMQSLLNNPALAALNSITIESYRYREPAFYTPEAMSSLIVSYDRAGWHHLVNANVSPAESASPQKSLTDMWLHFHGTDIDGCTVVIRAVKQMNVIEVSGLFRPLDLLKLSGHFGIPKIDPGALMVPATPGH